MSKREIIRRMKITKLIKTVDKSLRNLMAEDIVEGIYAAEKIINIAMEMQRDAAILYGRISNERKSTPDIMNEVEEGLKQKREEAKYGK